MEINKIKDIVKYPFVFHYSETHLNRSITIMELSGCGMVILTHTIEGNHSILHSLSVNPDSQNCGIGTKLISMCEDLSRLLNVGCITLYVEANTWQYTWYIRLGYEPESIDLEIMKTNYVLMRKRL